jgi:carboxymethylenebutenolidase
MSQQPNLTSDQQKLDAVWNEHLRSEFEAHSADQTLATMVENPMVKLVPVMLGGDGKEGVHEFYSRCFLRQIPPDAVIVPVSRTIGQGRLVEEIVFRFTHTIQMDWVLPGITPTGKRVEMAMLIVVQFDGDKMVQEHIYWDQASVLVQIGLLLPARLPVVGAEGARSVLDRSIPLNALLNRASGAVAASRLPAKRSAIGEVFRGLTNQRTRA